MQTGDILDNRYELTEALADGGMGQVFKAWDRQEKRRVAVKAMLPQFCSDPAAMRDLEREVRICRTLNHVNIVQVYEHKVHQRTPFIVMEFVEGEPLSFFLARQSGQRLDEAAFRAFASEILAAVEHAHSNSVVHRDLKPGNIMVQPNLHLKLLDFGIAATLKATFTRITGRGSTLTIPYASPEQINGEDPTPSMDIYSLGCVFYEMLSGHPPFYQGEILHQQLTKAPKPLFDVSPELNFAVLACLEKDPAKRLRTIQEIRVAIAGQRTVRIQPTAQAPPPRPSAQEPRPSLPPPQKRDRRPMALLGVAGALVVIGGLVWATLDRPQQPVTTDPIQKGASAEYPRQPVATPEPSAPPVASSRAPVADFREALRAAKAAHDEGNYEEAAAAYRAVLARDAGNSEAQRGLAEARRGREAESLAAGEQLLSTGEYDAAMEQYRKILALDPGNARASRALEAARKGKATENSIR